MKTNQHCMEKSDSARATSLPPKLSGYTHLRNQMDHVVKGSDIEVLRENNLSGLCEELDEVQQKIVMQATEGSAVPIKSSSCSPGR